MTQQFKFGDRVRLINNPGQFIYLDPDEHTPDAGWIISEGCGQYLIDHINLEPIPHPDTVRLDWLADRDNRIGNVQLPAECVACNLHSLRDAIDMAMRMDKENTGTQGKDV